MIIKKREFNDKMIFIQMKDNRFGWSLNYRKV